ncbi:hypothetical protein GCM10022223_67620 [Kineosporia mesophila]|uniref:Uncharacterized protein n=1 Tax=Kineosporia mesophila TaxID=566012 RepID=A0ABP7ARL8_9ACTN
MTTVGGRTPGADEGFGFNGVAACAGTGGLSHRGGSFVTVVTVFGRPGQKTSVTPDTLRQNSIRANKQDRSSQMPHNQPDPDLPGTGHLRALHQLLTGFCTLTSCLAAVFTATRNPAPQILGARPGISASGTTICG